MAVCSSPLGCLFPPPPPHTPGCLFLSSLGCFSPSLPWLLSPFPPFGTNDYEVNLHKSAFPPINGGPRDLSEPTLSGAAVSCCTMALGLYLFTSELLPFQDRRRESEMFIDDTRMEEKLDNHLNITLPALPCGLLSYIAQDVMGSHEMDTLGDLFKGRLNSKDDVIAKEEMHGSRHGQYWGLTRHFNFGYDIGDVYRIKNMVHSGEDCKVPGYVWVNRVPGNIHFWTYSHAYLFCSLCRETQGIIVSHHVDHVSFGTDTVINLVNEHFAGTRFVSPLNGVHQVVEQSTTTTTTPNTRRLYGSIGKNLDQASGGIFEKYTKMVPTPADAVHVSAVWKGMDCVLYSSCFSA